MTNDSLNDCPFCGKVAVTVNQAHYGEVVGCGDPYCAGGHIRVPQEAWNKRTQPSGYSVVDNLLLEIDVAKACVPFAIDDKLEPCVKAVLEAIRPHFRSPDPVRSGEMRLLKKEAFQWPDGVGHLDMEAVVSVIQREISRAFGCAFHSREAGSAADAILKKLKPLFCSPEPVSVYLEAGARALWQGATDWSMCTEQHKEHWRGLAKACAEAWGLKWR